MYDVTNSLYRDAGCPGQCSGLYEYASVDEMNGINGALPIPESTAKRFYQTPSTVNAQGQVVNPIQAANEAAAQAQQAQVAAAQATAAAQQAQVAAANFIRMNRRF
jgi:hypothetical protein